MMNNNMNHYFINKLSIPVTFYQIEDGALAVTIYKITADETICETQRTFGHDDEKNEFIQALIKQFNRKYERITENYFQHNHHSYYLQLSYDDIYEHNKTINTLFTQMENTDFSPYKSLNIGLIGESNTCYQDIIDYFIQHQSTFNHIQRFFFADVESEECEISWIEQGHYETFLQTFPNLRELIIKGGTSLELGQINHPSLTQLQIITGGLPHNVIDSLAKSHLPKLQSLILYLGVADYGCDIDIKTLAQLADKDRFPALTELGLCNSEEQDEIVNIVLNSNILPQLSVLDLSCGALTDKGGQMLLEHRDQLTHLSSLNLHYHYLSGEMIDKLKQLPIAHIDISDQQVSEEYDGELYTYPLYTE